MPLSQTINLIQKEIRSEWRQKYAINGILLYLASTVFVCYMSFNLRAGVIQPITWNALFWIIILFTAVNSISKSFIQESNGRLLYLYTLAKAESIILAKVIYYSLLMILLSLVGFFLYSLVMGNPIQDFLIFLITITLGSAGLASALTLLSGIASKAANSSSLVAILSFPVVIPLLLVLIKCSKNAIDGIERSLYYDDLGILVAINAIIIAISYMLFPYLWRS
jgi:heme exporter protein B